MKYRISSDIHTEFFNEDEIYDLSAAALPYLDDDHETTLLLAGDIGSMHKPDNIEMFLKYLAPRFLQIVYIPGNHEYYRGNLLTTSGVILKMTSQYPNVAFSTLGTFVPKKYGRVIHHATLWTDFDKENPLSMNEAARRMNDYSLILNGKKRALPSDTLELHKLTVDYLEKNIMEGAVVMTYHSPSFQSLPEEYKHERVNGAYHSDLEALILRRRPSIWVHGHTHTATRYKVGDTEIICNPRGYGHGQCKKNGYDPTLVVEL